MPEETHTWTMPKARPLGSSGNSVQWLGMPAQTTTAVGVTSGRKPVDLDKVPAYLRDTGRFRG